MMEKQGIVDEQHTPPETPQQKPEELADHVVKRAADVATEKLQPRSAG